ncbi:MAG: hypothetical protein IPO25_22730 [Saprospiraceae bacterium]|nr:hypothetical protein [Saprospiraceae bacterium]
MGSFSGSLASADNFTVNGKACGSIAAQTGDRRARLPDTYSITEMAASGFY